MKTDDTTRNNADKDDKSCSLVLMKHVPTSSDSLPNNLQLQHQSLLKLTQVQVRTVKKEKKRLFLTKVNKKIKCSHHPK